ncbi:hypothetical protein [Lacrimispora sp.]|uniref:hypothetical protein n=1 Tax=Lacrimispora sp. TaxID=2719234 RepID=UPI00285562C9|nr:hypothetical protein [Lacrimispora sp.]MDR7811507.1 hypothetical protein [Lacrimispora sp.]
MINLIKNETDIENIYTYFEFDGYSSWDEFDIILSILTSQIKCQVLEKLDGIYSKHCILEKERFVFKLMHHEDFGNCLCNQNKKDNTYYNQLEKISNEIISKLSS